jgi:hypothetical protein
LILELQQFETVKVRQRSTNVTLFNLLGPSGLVPGSNNFTLFQNLLESGLTSVTGKALENKRSQDHTAVRESLTGNTSSGAIDESTVMVDNVNNDSQFTGINTRVNKNNTTNFDLTLESTLL